VIAIFLLSCLIGSCSKANREDSPGKRGGDKAVPVTAATATVRSVPVEISTFGTVEPYSTVTIRSQVSGIITKVHFKKGQRVRKGDLLFTIDPRPFKAALDEAEANLARDTVEMENAQKDAERESALFTKGLSPQADLDKAKTGADSLAAKVRADAALVDRAKLNLENCSITSPIDGRVGNILVDEGNLVNNNDTASFIVTINQTSPIQVFFSVPQVDLPDIRRYMATSSLKVQACAEEDDTGGAWGRLVFMDNAVDKGTGTIRLGADFENGDERLWPGQYVLIKLLLTTRDDAIVVPSRAIETGRDGKYVFVITADNTVEVRAVAVGMSTDDMTVIEKGLQPGERVVTDGQLRLAQGMKVEVKSDRGGSGTIGASTSGRVATSRAAR
jgi:multidrug efflux system membrane fusion protein